MRLKLIPNKFRVYFINQIFCLCLVLSSHCFTKKIGKKVEPVRKKIADMGEEELTSSQWAKAAGITQQRLVYILC